MLYEVVEQENGSGVEAHIEQVDDEVAEPESVEGSKKLGKEAGALEPAHMLPGDRISEVVRKQIDVFVFGEILQGLYAAVPVVPWLVMVSHCLLHTCYPQEDYMDQSIQCQV
jgi:hypothetical protein